MGNAYTLSCSNCLWLRRSPLQFSPEDANHRRDAKAGPHHLGATLRTERANTDIAGLT